MLLPAQATAYARQLLAARAASTTLPRLTDSEPLTTEDGYRIAEAVRRLRQEQGEQMIGRKLGFTNRKAWDAYGVSAPFWAPLFDSTVRYARDNTGRQSLEGAVQPRIQPEIIFKLSRAPGSDATIVSIADCIEWIAAGFEIVCCPYPDWQFAAAEAIAAYGLHGTLIIGEPVTLSEASRRNLAAVLANTSVSLSCTNAEQTALRAAGFGSTVLDSPVHALLALHQLLQQNPGWPQLETGEVIATGTLTDAFPIVAGETWTTAFAGSLILPGLSVAFV
jgi:2-keto-4-pentenoate hydratase